MTAQLRYEVGVHRGHAAAFGFGLGTAATQVERLIAADVELACAEQLHVSSISLNENARDSGSVMLSVW